MRANRLLALLFAVGAAGAVAMPAHAMQGPVAEEKRAEERVTVRVDNRNFYDMRIYVVSQSQSRRLGTVTGLSSEQFELPRWISLAASDVRLVAVPIGRRGAAFSQAVIVNPGDQVEFRINNHLALSSVWIH